jgi:hypothetical protein
MSGQIAQSRADKNKASGSREGTSTYEAAERDPIDESCSLLFTSDMVTSLFAVHELEKQTIFQLHQLGTSFTS